MSAGHIFLPKKQNVVTYTVSGSFTVPFGVTQIGILAAGGGGGGSGGAGTPGDGGLGGNGAVPKFVAVPVTPELTYTINIGSGGSGGIGTGPGIGGNGGDTTFSGNGLNLVWHGALGGPSPATTGPTKGLDYPNDPKNSTSVTINLDNESSAGSGVYTSAGGASIYAPGAPSIGGGDNRNGSSGGSGYEQGGRGASVSLVAESGGISAGGGGGYSLPGGTRDGGAGGDGILIITW